METTFSDHSDRKLKVNSVFTHHFSGANLTLVTIHAFCILVLLEIFKHSTGLIFFSLVYSLKWLSREVSLPLLLISRREYRSMTVCAMNLAKITRITDTKMNCWRSWRNVVDKFDMSPEDAKKKSRTFAFFLFSAITAIIWKPVDR